MAKIPLNQTNGIIFIIMQLGEKIFFEMKGIMLFFSKNMLNIFPRLWILLHIALCPIIFIWLCE